MANTKSAKKANRQSLKKKEHNLYWKRRIREVVKTLRNHLGEKDITPDIIAKDQSVLYKILDKAAKEKAIHKNKASRLKSRLSLEISAHAGTATNATKPKERTKKSSK